MNSYNLPRYAWMFSVLGEFWWILSGWWFGTFFVFPFSWECHNPNWYIFSWGVGIPPASCWSTMIYPLKATLYGSDKPPHFQFLKVTLDSSTDAGRDAEQWAKMKQSGNYPCFLTRVNCKCLFTIYIIHLSTSIYVIVYCWGIRSRSPYYPLVIYHSYGKSP